MKQSKVGLALSNFSGGTNRSRGLDSITHHFNLLLHLIKAKCLPVLLYGVDECLVNVSDMRSLEFTMKRTMIKLFRTYDNGIINSCMSFFGLPTVSELVSQRKNRVQLKCNLLDNLSCNVCQSQ